MRKNVKFFSNEYELSAQLIQQMTEKFLQSNGAQPDFLVFLYKKTFF